MVIFTCNIYWTVQILRDAILYIPKAIKLRLFTYIDWVMEWMISCWILTGAPFTNHRWKLGHGWVIIFHCFTKCNNPMMVYLFSVSKRGRWPERGQVISVVVIHLWALYDQTSTKTSTKFAREREIWIVFVSAVKSDQCHKTNYIYTYIYVYVCTYIRIYSYIWTISHQCFQIEYRSRHSGFFNMI